jgi:hypothetical protein
MPCCLENKLVSAADLAEADPARIGAALGAMLRRPLRRTEMVELDETIVSANGSGLASAAPTSPNLAL